MTLADYLGSEQAREDVRELLASDKPRCKCKMATGCGFWGMRLRRLHA